MAIKIVRNIPPFDTATSDKQLLYISGSTIKFDSVTNIGLDARYVLTSSFDNYSGSFNGFTASFSASVVAIGDLRYVFTSSFDAFSGSMKTFTASQITTNATQATLNTNLNTFTASINTFSQSVNIFTASINAFTQSLSVPQTGEIILAVSTAGMDLNASRPKLKSGSYLAFPFRSFQGAIDQLTADTNRTLNYNVYITSSAGTFDGFNLEGFTGKGEITVAGAYTISSVSSGTLSGTAGAGSTSTAANKPTGATNWPSGSFNELRGKVIIVDSGGGASTNAYLPTIRFIESNTTSSISFPEIFGFDSTSVFRIVDVGTTVTSASLNAVTDVTTCVALVGNKNRVKIGGIKFAAPDVFYGLLGYKSEDIYLQGCDFTTNVYMGASNINVNYININDSWFHSASYAEVLHCDRVELFGILQNSGSIDVTNCRYASISTNAQGNNATSVRMRNVTKGNLNARIFSASLVTPVVLENVSSFTVEALAGANPGVTTAVSISKGGEYILTNASITAATNDFTNEGLADSWANLASVGSSIVRGTSLYWGDGYTFIPGTGVRIGRRSTPGNELIVDGDIYLSGNLGNNRGHLILTSSVGSTVAVSGNLKVIGDISSANLDSRYVLTSSYDSFTASLNSFSQSVNSFTASQQTLNSALNTFSASVNVFSASQLTFNSAHNTFSSSVNAFTASQITLNSNLNAFSASVNAFTASQLTFNSAHNSFSASVNAFTASQATLNTSLNTFSASINVFSQSVNTFTASQQTLNTALNGFTASFSSSVNSISDGRYVSKVNEYSGSITFVAGPNITINSGSGVIAITGSAGAVTTSLNGYSGSLSILAGPNITINSGSGFIMITGSAGASPTDISALNAFSQSMNGFSASFSASVKSIGDTRYVLTSSFDSYSGSVNAFTASQITTNTTQATLNTNLNSFTASFSASVKSIGDTRYVLTSSYDPFTGSLKGFTASFSSSVITLGDGRYVLTSSYGPFTASMNTFSQSVNTFTASQITTNTAQATLNTALNGFTASFSASSIAIGDLRYVTTASFGPFSASINTFSSSVNAFTASQITANAAQATLNTNLNTFSASINIFSQSMNGFTASFTSSVNSISDGRYVSKVNEYSGSLLILAGPNITVNSGSGFIMITGSAGAAPTDISALNTFSASVNSLTQSLNGFTASFTASVNSISDGRYVSNANGYSGSLQILAGPNITISSGSGFIMITGSAGGGSTQVTGSDNFFVTNLLKVSGTVANTVGDLNLSSSTRKNNYNW